MASFLGWNPRDVWAGRACPALKPAITTFFSASATTQPSELRNKTIGFITHLW